MGAVTTRELLAASLRILLALVVVLVVSGTARAEASVQAPIEVQVWPGAQPGVTMFVVLTEVPERVSLPATVRLPLPEGARVVWAGEVLGGPAADDPAREFTVVEGVGGSVVQIEALEGRVVQYEAIGGPLEYVDGLARTRFDWLHSVDPATVIFSVRVSPGVGEVRILPDVAAPPVTTELGERLYALPAVELVEGERHEILVELMTGIATEAPASERPILLWTLALLFLVTLVLAVVVYIERSRARGV